MVFVLNWVSRAFLKLFFSYVELRSCKSSQLEFHDWTLTSLKHRKIKRSNQADRGFGISSRISCNTQEMSESCTSSEIKRSGFCGEMPIKIFECFEHGFELCYFSNAAAGHNFWGLLNFLKFSKRSPSPSGVKERLRKRVLYRLIFFKHYSTN